MMKTRSISLWAVAALLLTAHWFCCPSFAARIVAWGYNGNGQCNVPDGDDFVATAAGHDHSLALRANGSIVAWGSNKDGQCNVPAGNDFVAIGSGDRHSLAIRSDGSVVAWGSNNAGQCNVPAGNDFVAVAGGIFHSLAMRSDGSVVTWGCGFGDYGQCGVPAGNDFAAIAANGLRSLGLRSDGSLIVWGDNGYGRDVPEGNDFVAVAAGGAHNLALRADGSLAAAGMNAYGQCNVPHGNDFVAIAAGIKYSLGLRANGSIVAWGGYETNWGQLDVPEGHNFIAIAAGTVHNLALVEEPTPGEVLIYVDAVHGDDTDDGRTPQTAFATIQKAIDSAEKGYPIPRRSPGILAASAASAAPVTVLVYPGVYTEAINFKGKAVTVTSAQDAATLQAPGDYAVSFYSGEGPASVLNNFVIRNSHLGIFIAGSSPTISNLTVVDNKFGIAAYAKAKPAISNCILWNNADGDLFGCEATYSWVQQELPTEQPEGLVSAWKFDEGSGTAAYDSASTNHASLHGAQWAAGRVGGGLNLEGDGDYIEIPAHPLLEPEHITVSLWVRPIRGRCIITNNKQNDDGAFVVQLDASGGLQSIVYTHDAPRYGTVVPISKNQWHHVAMTYDGDRMKTYLDGGLVADDNVVAGALPADGNKLYIGNREQADRDFDGTIDELMIFNRALFAWEVRAIYTAAFTGVFCADPLFVDPKNGDYHLRSQRGRYWPEHDIWVLDSVTSPCVDGGDPAMDAANERMPNGGRINMGAYGGTAYASMSDWPIASDLNRNGTVDLLDLVILCDQWLTELPAASIIPPDTTAPRPNPAQWAPDGKPQEVYGGGGPFDYRFEMKAAQATDASGSVEYFFECTTQPGWSSRWQADNSYTVLVGQARQGLRFRVKARDLYGNETYWSEELPAPR